MDEKEWDTFFDLLEKVVNLEMPVYEKTQLVSDKAEERGEAAEMSLEEFTAWGF
jgi:hypothetical protein